MFRIKEGSLGAVSLHINRTCMEITKLGRQAVAQANLRQPLFKCKIVITGRHVEIMGESMDHLNFDHLGLYRQSELVKYKKV